MLLDRGRTLGGIVTVGLGPLDARGVELELRDAGINTSATLREWALLDMDAKGVRTALRVSPHYYNTESEIDVLVDALGEILE